MLVYGLVRTDAVGWGSPQTIAALVIAAVLLARSSSSRRGSPTRRWCPSGSCAPALAGANLAMLCVGGSMFAMWYFVSLYLQGVLGESPLHGAGSRSCPARSR